ncbi:MAG: hypothetical protein HY699_08775 [Deltaproteobacteria bacterium]|nr:hypothetical protein [Deltaproteobacteria bacterium]
MTVVLVIALALAALTAAALVLRQWLRARRLVQVRADVRAAAQAAALPLSPVPAWPRMLDQPASADGLIVATPDGQCTYITAGARTLLGLDGSAGTSCRLHALLRDGEREATGILADLRARPLLAARRVRPAARPELPIEVAAVALRDRAGNLWGAALLLRSAALATDPQGR